MGHCSSNGCKLMVFLVDLFDQLKYWLFYWLKIGRLIVYKRLTIGCLLEKK